MRQVVGPVSPWQDGELSRSPPAPSAQAGMSLLAGESPGSLLLSPSALRTVTHPHEGLPTALPHGYRYTHDMTGALIRAGSVCLCEWLSP